MTENGPLPAAKHRGVPPSPPVEKGMTHRIHPSVHAMQRPTLKPAIDLVFRRTQAHQLLAGHKPMLGSGQLRNRGIKRPGVTDAPFPAHSAGKGARVNRHGPMVKRPGARVVRCGSYPCDRRRKRDSSPPVPPLALIP